MGGEKLILLVATPGREGSPPRGRGKGCPEGHGPPSKGITPAWAGKSHAVHSPSHGAGDHPRVGGEKIRAATNHSSTLGSPPRGRGKAAFADFIFEYSRITPAWAGKSPHCSAFYRLPGDHPRVGGEKIASEQISMQPVGSPPRGRGKAKKPTMNRKRHRITPAWAGKRAPTRRNSSYGRDHPRVGGEK